MKRNLATILLLSFSVLLLICSIFLYRIVVKDKDSHFSAAPQTASRDPVFPVTSPNVQIPSITQQPVTVVTPADPADDDSSLDPAVDFTMTDADGRTVHLSDFYGKPIIINFWATWCGPCQAELPHFDSASRIYGDRIQFLMVDLVDGGYETEDATKAFVNSNAYQFPLFFDSLQEGLGGYEISAIPLTVTINASGRIVETHVGSMDAYELQQLIDNLLN